jgi:hypothetical protein
MCVAKVEKPGVILELRWAEEFKGTHLLKGNTLMLAHSENKLSLRQLRIAAGNRTLAPAFKANNVILRTPSPCTTRTCDISESIESSTVSSGTYRAIIPNDRSVFSNGEDLCARLY